MPTILPSNLNPDQQEAYLGNYQFDFSSRCSHLYLQFTTPIDDHKTFILWNYLLINDFPLRPQSKQKKKRNHKKLLEKILRWPSVY